MKLLSALKLVKTSVFCRAKAKNPSIPYYLFIEGRKEKVNSCFSQSKVKLKQHFPGFELGMPSSFPVSID